MPRSLTACLGLLMLVLPAVGAVQEAGPRIAVSVEGHDWTLNRLTIDQGGWYVRTEHDLDTRLVQDQVLKAEIVAACDRPAVFHLADGTRTEVLEASYQRGRWLLKTVDVTDVEVQQADVYLVQAELPPPAEPVAADPDAKNPAILRFSGEIDYAEGLFVSGKSLTIEQQRPWTWWTTTGPIRNLQYSFERPLPAHLASYYLDDLKIDDEAEWALAQPTGKNGYCCAIRVLDRKEGYHKVSFVLRECRDLRDPLPASPGPWTEYATRRLTWYIPTGAVWWDTGWEVEPGSEVTVWCSGIWQVYRDGGVHWVGPAGLAAETDPEALLPDVECGAVVARTNLAAPFYVGIFARRNIPEGGQLYLSQNGVPQQGARPRGLMKVFIQGRLRRALGVQTGQGTAFE